LTFSVTCLILRVNFISLFYMADTLLKFRHYDSLRCPVEQVIGIWKFDRKPYVHSHSRSTPGHLLHLILSGSYKIITEGREHSVRAGDVVYYYGSEPVEGIGDASHVTFYSVGFICPAMSPLPSDKRVFSSSGALQRAFDCLYEYSIFPESEKKTFGIYSALFEILVQISRIRLNISEGESSGLWWGLERKLREKGIFRPSIDELCEMSGKGRSAIVRACRKATGTSPMKWIQGIRMSEAHGLLQFSNLNITKIAQRLGYPRIHEFSREFSRHFGKAPRFFQKKHFS